MEISDKEVYFYSYCRTCEYANFAEDDEPCATCLEYPSQDYSHKPMMWSEKK